MHRCSALTLGAQVCYLDGLTVSMEQVKSSVQNVLGNDALGLQRFQTAAPLNQTAIDGNIVRS